MRNSTEPESISRKDYLAMIESLGLWPVEDVREIRFGMDGIHAVVVVRDENGKTKISGYETAKRHVHIPVTEP